MSWALNDTPASTAPNSPRFIPRPDPDCPTCQHMSLYRSPMPVRQNSGSSTPRVRPTTLDIPGLTKSKVSPDGRIASRDVGSKLVILCSGLPARGKSYLSLKLARYLNWLQHDTRIFNVGERRRVAAGVVPRSAAPSPVVEPSSAPTTANTSIPPLPVNPSGELQLTVPDATKSKEKEKEIGAEEQIYLDQSATFFDPLNKKAAQIREQCALDTLDELLDYILDQNGAVGILDATNSTLARRKLLMQRIRARAGPELNVLFLESKCDDEQLLESNMRLKLSGPDYKGKDPVAALADFKKRVAIYENNYEPLGEYEEKNNIPYIQMVDVGRKIISHQIKGFLMAQTNYYLLNFNLAPRQIWITRHGMSYDNISGKLGGDSDLASEGIRFGRTLAKFMTVRRQEWDLRQLHKLKHSHMPPQQGDATPPNPHYQPTSGIADDLEKEVEIPSKPFCVWSSMMKRSIQTAQLFDEEEYDVKQMRMLDELNAGTMEGQTYSSIAEKFPEEYALRKKDKLHYRYPGPGGEGYLDVINRLRPVIVELERMTDHVLLVGHRSVSRVLLAYFRGLKREEVADLDVPIGMLYCLEPKPYGVEFKAFRWNKETEWFYEEPNFRLQRDEKDML